MFDSVLGRGVGAPGRPGVGAAVSVGLHALVLALAIQISHPPLPTTLVLPPFHPPFGGRGAAAPAGPRPTPPGTHRAVAKPRSPTAVTPDVRQSSDVTAPSEGALVPSGGDARGTGQEPSCPSPPCSVEGTGDRSPVLLLGPEMVRPRLLFGPEPRYTAEAALEHVGGTVLVQCTVTVRGNVEECVVMKSLPLLDASVLRALTARRYEPALFEGRPVSVRMVLPVRFVPP